MLTRLWHGRDNRKNIVLRDKRRRTNRLCVESLEERHLLSTDVVILWNQAVLNAIRNDKPSIGFLTRDLAIVHAAIYDAVNSIDQTSAPFHAQVQAPADASAEAAARGGGALYRRRPFPNRHQHVPNDVPNVTGGYPRRHG